MYLWDCATFFNYIFLLNELWSQNSTNQLQYSAWSDISYKHTKSTTICHIHSTKEDTETHSHSQVAVDTIRSRRAKTITSYLIIKLHYFIFYTNNWSNRLCIFCSQPTRLWEFMTTLEALFFNFTSVFQLILSVFTTLVKFHCFHHLCPATEGNFQQKLKKIS